MCRKPLPLLLLALTACASGAGTPPGTEVVAPRELVMEGLPFSPAVRAGGFIFLSGAVGNRRGTRELVPGGVAAETRQALENLRAALRAADADMVDVVKCTVFLADMRDYEAMNQAYAAYFRSRPPARTTAGVNGLALGARVEIECIARDPS